MTLDLADVGSFLDQSYIGQCTGAHVYMLPGPHIRPMVPTRTGKRKSIFQSGESQGFLPKIQKILEKLGKFVSLKTGNHVCQLCPFWSKIEVILIKNFVDTKYELQLVLIEICVYFTTVSTLDPAQDTQFMTLL